MKGAAGPRWAPGHRVLGEGPGAAQAPSGRDAPCQGAGDSASLRVSAPGMARAQLPWDGQRFTHCTATALFPAQPVCKQRHGKLGDVIHRRKILSAFPEMTVTWQQDALFPKGQETRTQRLGWNARRGTGPWGCSQSCCCDTPAPLHGPRRKSCPPLMSHLLSPVPGEPGPGVLR